MHMLRRSKKFGADSHKAQSLLPDVIGVAVVIVEIIVVGDPNDWTRWGRHAFVRADCSAALTKQTQTDKSIE
jgi:hypothetical protein